MALPDGTTRTRRLHDALRLPTIALIITAPLIAALLGAEVAAAATVLAGLALFGVRIRRGPLRIGTLSASLILGFEIYLMLLWSLGVKADLGVSIGQGLALAAFPIALLSLLSGLALTLRTEGHLTMSRSTGLVAAGYAVLQVIVAAVGQSMGQFTDQAGSWFVAAVTLAQPSSWLTAGLGLHPSAAGDITAPSWSVAAITAGGLLQAGGFAVLGVLWSQFVPTPGSQGFDHT